MRDSLAWSARLALSSHLRAVSAERLQSARVELSSYVCRIRDNSNLDTVIEEHPVSGEAAAANVLGDAIVDLGASKSHDQRPHHRVRVILIKTTPHTKRGRRKGGTAGPSSDGVLRIATNLLDVPAE
ncbi:MAG: hypothetical protein JOY71_28965 [Acetobacteraceae bacterium]|nr:hypothetical protein [Acetobacteraceae bacterium]